MKINRFAAFVGLLAVGTTVFAQDFGGTTESISLVPAMINKVIGNELLVRFKDAGLSVSTSLQDYARGIAGALALASMMWEALIAMKDDKPVMPVITESMLFTGVVIFLLSIYTQIANDFVDVGMAVSNAVSPGGIGSAATNFVTSFATAILTSFAKLWNVFGTTGIWDAVSILNGLSHIIDALLSVIFGLIAILFTCQALIEVLGIIFLGPMALAVGLALGPIFIATLASGWTRRWFDQWLNFTIGGAMLTAIIAFSLTVISQVVVRSITDNLGGGTYAAGSMLAMALFAAGMSKIIAQIPSMADALLPGRTGLGHAANGATPAKEASGTGKGTPASTGAPTQLAKAAVKATDQISKTGGRIRDGVQALARIAAGTDERGNTPK